MKNLGAAAVNATDVPTYMQMSPGLGVGNSTTGNLILPWEIVTLAAGQPVSGTLSLYPIDVWPAPLSIKALACNVTTAQVGGTGTLNQAVLYQDNGTGGAALVTSGGLLANVAVTTSSTGIKLTTVSLTLPVGRYWAGLLYYQGSVAPTTVPQYTCCTASSTLFNISSAFATSRFITRTTLTAAPTDSTAFAANTGSTAPVVALQVT